jgi:hypothetical protein
VLVVEVQDNKVFHQRVVVLMKEEKGVTELKYQ